jgi:hypothetical protein
MQALSANFGGFLRSMVFIVSSRPRIYSNCYNVGIHNRCRKALLGELDV